MTLLSQGGGTGWSLESSINANPPVMPWREGLLSGLRPGEEKNKTTTTMKNNQNRAKLEGSHWDHGTEIETEIKSIIISGL